VIAILVAPVVAQLSVLLEPAAMLAGLALKLVMVGTAGVTVTITVLVIAVPLEGVTVSV